VCTAFQSDYDSRPLYQMWTMAVSCPRILVPYFADHGFSPDKSRLTDEKTYWMKIESPKRVSAREAGEMMSPGNTRNDRFCCKRIALHKLGVLAWKHDPDDTTLSVLLVCIKSSSLFNTKVRDVSDGDFKYHYFVRCDFCNTTSEPREIKNFSTYFVEWMSTHILACKKTAQKTKELIVDRDLTVTFGQMKTSHYDGWDETVSRYLQAVRSSCFRGGCGDVSFAKLQHGKSKVMMHHYYSKVGVELMQEDGALEKKEILNQTQVHSVARSSLPLTSVGPHCILQDMYRKCYHFTNANALKMYDKKNLLWCTTNPGQFQLTRKL
jgi:hypothetical protein